MTDFNESFKPLTKSISEYFIDNITGYYIPIYQRKFSWNEHNINQLMSDICSGVKTFLDDSKNLRFLGTIILIQKQDKDRDIEKLDPKCIPSQFRKVIDGQQRISTIALLCCQLYKYLHLVKQNLPSDANHNELSHAIGNWQDELRKVFSFDLKRGKPSRKPIIIRGEEDKWVEFDSSTTTYISNVSKYISEFITAIDNNPPLPNFPLIPSEEPLKSVIQAIDNWLDKVVNAYEPKNEEDFPPAWDIIVKIDQSLLWNYDRPQIVAIVENRSNPMSNNEMKISSIIQILAFCHYLMNRCGFTIITPTTEDRAFDIFQSLNATGTPLTAIETFKPLVVNAGDKTSTGYSRSTFETHYEEVENLFSTAKSASAKNTLTNEYLTAFALVQNGEKLPNQFSLQRMWLTKNFDQCKNLQDSEEFVRRMGNLATYWTNVVHFIPNGQSVISDIAGKMGAEEASLAILYLKDAGHAMANTILSRFYSLILRKKVNAETEFIEACKAVAAFFTLWRSALPNKDLDDVYRKLLQTGMSWQYGDSNLTSKRLKDYLRQALKNKDIDTYNDWSVKAHRDLRYDTAKAVCKFVLFVVSHNTVPDSNPMNIGLMEDGVAGTNQYLLPKSWRSTDLKTIEHIAPQKDTRNAWDSSIYQDGYEQRIGNLILLPGEINSTVGSKAWQEKWFYYSYLACKTPAQRTNVENDALAHGITMTQGKVKKLLADSKHQSHIIPIVQLGMNGIWNKNMIEKRTQRICEILWKRMDRWLS